MLRDPFVPEPYRWVLAEFEPEGDPGPLLEIGVRLEAEGNLQGAATILDRAFGLDPLAPAICEARQRVLDRLEVVENGLRFRYVPGGVFLRGRLDGEPDEGPCRPVWLSPFWLTETPISWAAYCRLMDWEPPPVGLPRDEAERDWERSDTVNARFHVWGTNRIRLQYCEDHTLRAMDWHAHDPGQLWGRPGETAQTAQELFGTPPRSEPNAPWQYEAKPMVAVGWEQAMEFGRHLSTRAVQYSLPTEAQWEKAARGGLIGAPHAWGHEPPAADRCDFDRFHQRSILPSKSFPPNGYGLYAMNGGVWEWARDWYYAQSYESSPDADPEGLPDGKEKVLRGGSWADCAEVVTVTFRMSRPVGLAAGDQHGRWAHMTPNVGFRLCRTAVAAGAP